MISPIICVATSAPAARAVGVQGGAHRLSTTGRSRRGAVGAPAGSSPPRATAEQRRRWHSGSSQTTRKARENRSPAPSRARDDRGDDLARVDGQLQRGEEEVVLASRSSGARAPGRPRRRRRPRGSSYPPKPLPRTARARPRRGSRRGCPSRAGSAAARQGARHAGSVTTRQRAGRRSAGGRTPATRAGRPRARSRSPHWRVLISSDDRGRRSRVAPGAPGTPRPHRAPARTRCSSLAEPVPSVRWMCASRSPSRSAISIDVGRARSPRARGRRGVGVGLVDRVPAGDVHLHLAARGPPRDTCSRPRTRCRSLLQLRDAVDEAAGVLALPAERRVHDDHVGADRGAPSRRSARACPTVGAPDPLGDQQAGRVDRADGHLVVVGQLLERASLLADSGSMPTITSTPS